MSRYRVQDQLVRTGVLATVGAIAGLGVAAGLTAYEGLSLASSYERAAISFEVMTGSAERGKQMLADINQLALTTPFRSSTTISPKAHCHLSTHLSAKMSSRQPN
jgi:hypothetical protein